MADLRKVAVSRVKGAAAALRKNPIVAALESGFDRPRLPAFARPLYHVAQAFIALLYGFLFTVLIFLMPETGPVLAILGMACAPCAFLLLTLAVRMEIESALAIIALHDRAAQIQDDQSPSGAHARTALPHARQESDQP